MSSFKYVNSSIVFTLVWNFQGCEQGFTHISDNAFTNTYELIPFGGGIRIDYILFKVNVNDFTVGHIVWVLHLHSLALFLDKHILVFPARFVYLQHPYWHSWMNMSLVDVSDTISYKKRKWWYMAGLPYNLTKECRSN